MGGARLPGGKMLEHHGGVETAIPHFRGTVASGFQSEVDFQAFVAAFGGSSGVVLQFPFLRISERDVDKSGVVLHGKMDCAAPFSVRAGTRARAGHGAAVHERAAKFGTALGKLHAAMAHGKTRRADGYAVRANGEIIFILSFTPRFSLRSMKGTMPCLRQYS